MPPAQVGFRRVSACYIERPDTSVRHLGWSSAGVLVLDVVFQVADLVFAILQGGLDQITAGNQAA